LRGKVWPAVKQDICDLYASGKHEGVFCEAIGAGKSTKAAIIAAYEVHRVLCLKDPQATFGLLPESKLTVMNMGPRAAQARKVVFGKIKALVENAYWFQTRFPHDAKIITELRFPKDVYVIPGNSQETFPIGYDLICAILDEASFYTDAEGRDVADEIWLAMQRRLESRMADRWPWKLIGISSPKYEDDFTERKMRDETIFRRRRKLWEAKPDQYGDNFVTWEPNKGESYEIPKSLLGYAMKNAHKFKRDFMAMASGALDPYFSNRDAIEAGIDRTLRWVDGPIIPEDFKPESGRSYVFHIDLGHTRDACGVAIGHREGPHVKLDLVWRIAPGDGREVNFAAVRDAILALRNRGFRFSRGSYDGWQSVDSIQIMNRKGIECDVLSIDRNLEPYDTLLEGVNQGTVHYPEHPVLIHELRNLEMVKGKKVDHPPKGSKDLADACAGVCYHLRVNPPGSPQSVLIARSRPGPGARGYYGRSPY